MSGGDAATAMRRRRIEMTRAVCYQDDNRVSLRIRHVKMRPGHNPGPLG